MLMCNYRVVCWPGWGNGGCHWQDWFCSGKTLDFCRQEQRHVYDTSSCVRHGAQDRQAVLVFTVFVVAVLCSLLHSASTPTTVLRKLVTRDENWFLMACTPRLRVWDTSLSGRENLLLEHWSSFGWIPLLTFTGLSGSWIHVTQVCVTQVHVIHT